jgi:tetratricopeptide (TPR) repeat protein
MASKSFRKFFPIVGSRSVLMGRTIAITAATVLFGFAVAVSQVHANEDTPADNSGSKSCPKGSRYSSSKGRCVKTSCGVGEAWHSAADACVDGRSAALSDEDLYLAGRDLGQEGRYAEALKLFFLMRDRHQARVLSSIGYSTRKLGDVDKGIDYYHQALAIDANYTKVREYLGEAYLQKGDIGKAKEQLMEIADRCGGPCDDYELLVKAIAAHVTGEKIVDW